MVATQEASMSDNSKRLDTLVESFLIFKDATFEKFNNSAALWPSALIWLSLLIEESSTMKMPGMT